jgi:outer membrane receptor protein involved in Fe transport
MVNRAGDVIVKAILWTAVLTVAATVIPVSAQAVADSYHLDIAQQPLDGALKSLAQQTGLQIARFSDSPDGGAVVGPVSGDLNVRQAMARLLASTGLTYRMVNDRTIAVMTLAGAGGSGGASAAGSPSAPSAASNPGNSQKEGKTGSSATFQLAQAAPEQAPSAASVNAPELQEVVVTGTHLKDVTETASRLIVFSRAEIDQSGLGSVGAFVQSLPQNFNNVSETTIASVAGGLSSNNAVNAAGVNLHGMGSDATLVLVDGHRVAPGNTDGGFVDVSMIPLSAVERIEILTDGASAIYGADAVGGVINIIMRKDLDGLETRARVGSVTDGASHETQLGQSAGTHWGTGSALMSYEFYDRTPLSAADRPYTASAPLPFSLLPEQLRQSAFASIDQSVGSNISVFGDGLYSHRSTYTDATVVGAFSQHAPTRIDEYSATAGGRWRISATTELELSGGYASSDTDSLAYDLGTPAPTTSTSTRTRLETVDTVLRGPLASAPAGPLQYAVGGQYRHESYDSTDYVAQSVFEPSRNVAAGFAELRVPLVSPAMAIPAVQRLELELADREEHYSDFGSTNNPTFGLIWKPLAALKIRGTYGRSFVAPLLSELNPVPFEVVGFNTALAPGSAPPGGDVNELVVFGGNPDLKAQTARTWTIGADWEPEGGGGPRAHLNYYVIDFTDRITNLQSAGYNVFYALPMASVLGPQIVQPSPAAALVRQLTSAPGFVNFGATSLTDFAAVVDSRELNLSSVDSRGLDFSLSYRLELGALSVEPGIDGTYVFDLTNQFTATTPAVSAVNTLYNPTRLKARGHVVATDGPWNLAAFVNYVSSYKNGVTVQQVEPIASWTTVDLTAGYACAACEGLLKDLSVSLGVINVANRAPPYAANANGFAIDYDGANASPLGRYAFLQLTKHW